MGSLSHRSATELQALVSGRRLVWKAFRLGHALLQGNPLRPAGAETQHGVNGDTGLRSLVSAEIWELPGRSLTLNSTDCSVSWSTLVKRRLRTEFSSAPRWRDLGWTAVVWETSVTLSGAAGGVVGSALLRKAALTQYRSVVQGGALLLEGGHHSDEILWPFL